MAGGFGTELRLRPGRAFRRRSARSRPCFQLGWRKRYIEQPESRLNDGKINMEVKEAVTAAKKCIMDLFAEEGITNVGLEEIDLDHGDT